MDLKTGKVTLEFYNERYQSIKNDYVLPEEQLEFTCYPREAMERGETENDWMPIVILYNGEPAGFFVLHGWDGVKEYSPNRHALLLRSYSINMPFQGKGIATASLHALDDFVRKEFPSTNEIILGVNLRNTFAQHVYKKGGFIDKGNRLMGPKGEQMILHKAI